MRKNHLIVGMAIWCFFDIFLSILLSFLSSPSWSVNVRTVILYSILMMFLVPISLILYSIKSWITYLIIVRRQMVACWLSDFERWNFPKPNADDGVVPYLQGIMSDDQQLLATRMQAAATLGGLMNHENSMGYSKGRMLTLSAEEALKQYNPKLIFKGD